MLQGKYFGNYLKEIVALPSFKIYESLMDILRLKMEIFKNQEAHFDSCNSYKKMCTPKEKKTEKNSKYINDFYLGKAIVG